MYTYALERNGPTTEIVNEIFCVGSKIPLLYSAHYYIPLFASMNERGKLHRIVAENRCNKIYVCSVYYMGRRHRRLMCSLTLCKRIVLCVRVNFRPLSILFIYFINVKVYKYHLQVCSFFFKKIMVEMSKRNIFFGKIS